MEQYRSEEIDLMDYINTILRRKRLVFVVFLLTMIAAGVYSYSSPKVYKVATLIEVGRIAGSPIEKSEEIKGKIDERYYDDLVLLKTDLEALPTIKTVVIKDTNLVKLAIESVNPEQDKRILEEMNNAVLADHERFVRNKKASVEQNIKNAESKIKLLENSIARVENNIAALQEEKKNIESRELGLEGLRPWEGLGQTLSGAMFAILDAREKLAGKKREIENAYIQINIIRNEKEGAENQIDALRASMNDISATRIIKSPYVVAGGPVGPRPLFSMAVAAVLGLFLGIGAALTQEWWKRGRQSSAERIIG